MRVDSFANFLKILLKFASRLIGNLATVNFFLYLNKPQYFPYHVLTVKLPNNPRACPTQ